MSRRPPQPESPAAPPANAGPGDPARWVAYTSTALRYIAFTTQQYPEKPTVLISATIPGFEGLSYASVDGERFLIYFRTALEHWIAYRLANRLPIPELPGVDPPTLEDLAELNAVAAGRAFDQAIVEDAAMPLEQLLAAQQPTSGWVLADERLLARDWLTPEEDEAWQGL